MAIINLTDLIPIKHGDAVLKVESVRQRKTKDWPQRCYRGWVLVEFPKTPSANYSVPVEGDYRRPDETDAIADAIALRREIIDQNRISMVPA